MTTAAFGYRELVVAPVLSDAIGVVVGAPAGPGLGLTLLVRPRACGVGGTSATSTLAPELPPEAVPVVP